MNIKFPVIIFLVQSSYIWTTKTEDSSSAHYHVGMPRDYESDNKSWLSVLVPECSRTNCNLSAIFLYLILPAIFLYFILPALIVIAVVLALVNGTGTFERSFAPEFFKIGVNFINHEQLDVLTAVVEKSIDVITKL